MVFLSSGPKESGGLKFSREGLRTTMGVGRPPGFHPNFLQICSRNRRGWETGSPCRDNRV